MKTHGLSHTREYKIWRHMLSRTSPTSPFSERYYERGIVIEDPLWFSVENFISDMGECPQGYSLDRIDNNRGYTKDNCRWASATTQQRNRRYCITSEVSETWGNLYREGKSIREISEEYGRPFKTVWKHLVDLGVHTKKNP
ncbi:hypothetical protein Syn7803C9_109 [Synechococcus phage ACG-2014f]|uniref:Uncharacterized protein n=1 Tax=Synechococcus phage ACG-2014f TaxID=1493511 RepID=A0A0E3FBK0_9CAUD|nr:hypothetical protein Syn7803C9_109 [Synechococcus phage ACG-2014f]